MENNDIKALLDSGVDVNYSNNLGFTLLMGAAKNGDIDIIKFLVNNGAHINLTDHKDYCALNYATFHNKFEIIKYLVENGALVSDGIYMTAIHRNYKNIISYFDSLDESKKILQKNR